MPLKARYTVVAGEVLAEKRGGVRRLYVPDPLGSTVGLLDGSQSLTDTFTYWPYGEEKARTGSTATPFRFVGTQGYYRDKIERVYVRARHLRVDQGRWLTEDPIGFRGGDWNLYRYAIDAPIYSIDASGNQKGLPSYPIIQTDPPAKTIILPKQGNCPEEGSMLCRLLLRCSLIISFICAAKPAGPSSEWPRMPSRPKPDCSKDAPERWREKFCLGVDLKKFHDCMSRMKKFPCEGGKPYRGVSNPDVCIMMNEEGNMWLKHSGQYAGLLKACCDRLKGELSR